MASRLPLFQVSHVVEVGRQVSIKASGGKLSRPFMFSHYFRRAWLLIVSNLPAEKLVNRRREQRSAMSVGGQAVCVCLLVLLQFHQAAAKTSRGTEFFLGFMDVGYRSIGFSVEIIVSTIVANKSVTVNVSLPLLSWEETVQVTREKSVIVYIPRSAIGTGVELANKGVHVVASDEVSVFGLTRASSMTDSYVALPLSFLGHEYFVFTYTTQPEFMIVATEDNTEVSFILPPGITLHYLGVYYQAGQTLTMTMAKFQTFHAYVDSKSKDFTGTHIVASKPVAVLSGNKYVTIGSENEDHVVEMMLPVNMWGTRYFTAHTPNMQNGDDYKMVALEDETTITLGDDKLTLRKAGESWTTTVASTMYREITSDKPIMVAMFSRSYSKGLPSSDPSMMLIPPEKLYGNLYSWGTPVESYYFRNFVNSLSVIIDKDMLSGLVFDGATNPHWNDTSTIEGTNMVNVWMETSVGGVNTHVLKHNDPTVTFFAYLSGQNAKQISNYMSPAGFGTELVYCSITGDPHLHTFGGQTASLALPCAYSITKLRLINSGPDAGTNREIVVDVWGGNSQRPVNGRFYASDVCIKVTIGPHSNTYCTGEFLIANGTEWTKDTANAMEGRVFYSYSSANRMATFGIHETSFRLTFRPPARKEGNKQSLRPGIDVKVISSELVYDPSVKFPATLCSTVDDTGSIATEASKQNVSHKLMGIYSVLRHMESDIPHGDQDGLCSSFQPKLTSCDKAHRHAAFEECFALMRSHRIQLCFQEKVAPVTVSQGVLDCLDVRCTSGAAGCPELRSYAGNCSDISHIVNLGACP